MKLRKLYRAQSAVSAQLDKEKRTITFPFSSEYPVERWFGIEVLSHDDGCADLTRLNDGHPLLWNHRSGEVIGVVEKAWLDGEKRLWCTARFSKNAKAQEVMADVEDGILRNVSFGYTIDEMKEERGVGDAPSKYTATKWMPFEVSIVSIPADPTVGIGRADSDDEREVRIINDRSLEADTQPPVRGNGMTEEEKKALEAKIRSEAQEAERARIATISALGEKFNKRDLARQLIDSGKSADEARAAFIEQMGAAQKPITGDEAVVGLSDKEVRQFSFLRAMAALAHPNDRALQEAAKFEREVSDAAAKKTGKTPRGILIPVDVLRAGAVPAQRDLSVGTATAGGHTVATDLLAGSFIELLRKRSVLDRAGVQVLNGLSGNIAIPRQTGAATAYWVGEATAPTESAQAFDQVTMSPKTVGTYVDYSRKLLIQSSIDVENFVKQDLARVLALEIDRVGLYGSGSSDQPLGVKDTSGINTKDFAADAPTFAEIVALETEIAADNADVGTMAYLINARGRGVLKTTEKASSTGQFIWEPGNTVNGYRCEVSNQVDQVSSGKEHYWFGNWADLIMGFWSGLDLMVDPYSLSTSGSVRIVALQDMDVAVRHAESFCLGSNSS